MNTFGHLQFLFVKVAREYSSAKQKLNFFFNLQPAAQNHVINGQCIGGVATQGAWTFGPNIYNKHNIIEQLDQEIDYDIIEMQLNNPCAEFGNEFVPYYKLIEDLFKIDNQQFIVFLTDERVFIRQLTKYIFNRIEKGSNNEVYQVLD